MSIVITHTPADGTLLDGLTKPETRPGTDVRAVLDSYLWKWRPEPGWFQRQSRDRPPRRGRITGTARELRNLGYEVQVTVEDGHRDMATREAERGARMEARTERLQDRADRLHADGQARTDRADEFFEHLPFGQPIMGVRDRNRREKQHDRWMRGMEISHHGDRVQQRADTTSGHMDRRYAPRRVANRIERLETELRKVRLYLDEGTWYGDHIAADGTRRSRIPVTDPGHREDLERQAADLDEQIGYWRQVREQQLADGTARREYSKDDVAKGQQVRTRSGRWLTVTRVNAKSVTVDITATLYCVEEGRVVTETVPYRDIIAVRDAAPGVELD